MKIGFLNNIFRKQGYSKEDFDSLNRGLYNCLACHKPTDISECQPLTLLNCPYCEELFLVPGKAENWWLVKPLGSGGMGAVYEAVNEDNPEQKAAVKVLQDGGQVEQVFIDALMTEAVIASKFGNHPNIAETHAYGQSPFGFFFAMEMIPGERVDLLLEEHGNKLPMELVLYIAIDTIDALEHMYNCGYLYRDLKPENILTKEDGTTVLVDYGLCLSLEDAWNYNDDEIAGSPLYIPPERINGTGEDFRSDFYSLGMVLYYLLTGKPYFDQKEIMAIVQRHAGDIRLQTNFKLKGFDKNLITLIDRLIRFERSERFQSYNNIRSFINAILKSLKSQKTDNKMILSCRNRTPN